MNNEDMRLLKKEYLSIFLENLFQNSIVFGPVVKDDKLFFGRMETSDNLFSGQGNTVNSAKDAFFPQMENLLNYSLKEKGVVINLPFPEKKNLALFGIRPCDAQGLLLLDRIFGGFQQDTYYSDKRNSSIVISIACRNPDPACFCTALGGGPFSTKGSDLLLIDLGDQYLVKAGTHKGKTLFNNELFGKADDNALDQADIFEKKALDLMDLTALGNADINEDLERKLERLFDDPLWEDITESCLGCGICTYLCPVCHCFDILDEAGQSAGQRIRIWDSCQFPLFTRQASGFNPRPTVKERFRQRIMHKFCYLPMNENMTGCTGCGRCVTQCPVNLDIREVIQKISAREAV